MKIKVAVLPGDGIGPEVIREAVRVCRAVCQRFGHEWEAATGLVGAAAIDACGHPYPEETHRLCMESQAVLFGAIGSPKYDNDPSAKVRPEQGLLAMRKQLGLYANLRPLKVYDALKNRSPLRPDLLKDVDFVCVRELTGGMYFGERGRTNDSAFDTCVYSRLEIERILALAFQMARQRRHKLTVVDKANIMDTSRLWRQIAQEMAPSYPDVKVEYLYVDNAAMRLIQWPADFDVMVTENTFGDILTDEASVLSGSMGLLPSASVGEHTSLFEPIHGSYPQAAGKNIANPMATVLSAAMMFETSFGLKQEAALIEKAVLSAIENGIVTEDLCASGQKSFSTSEVGDYLCRYVEETC